MRKIVAIAGVGLTVVLIASACASSVAPGTTKRIIHMTAVEYKGSTDVAKEPFPSTELPDGGGYIRKEPKDGKWETSTYRWEPATIVVYQGDQVELQIFGVNGAEHPGRIEGYDKTFSVRRGQLTTLAFTADRAGIFQLLCDLHNPSMTAALVVLPR